MNGRRHRDGGSSSHHPSQTRSCRVPLCLESGHDGIAFARVPFQTASMGSRHGRLERRRRSPTATKRWVSIRMHWSTRREFLWQLLASVTTLSYHPVKQTPPRASPSNNHASQPNKSPGLLGTIFDTAIGSFLPPHPDRLLMRRMQRKGASPVLLVGESHTDRQHHRVQLAVLDAFVQHIRVHQGRSATSTPIAIGMEQFYRQHQRYLDRYIAGKIDLSRLSAATRFELTFGYSAQLWQDILEYARANQVQLVGLNTPFELVQLVAHYGLDKLPAVLHEVLPRDMDVHGNAVHRERFMRKMRELGVEAHGAAILDESALQRMYESQVLWDEYMSESAALWLQRNPNGYLCVFAGNGHVEGRVGLPDRLTRRSGRPTFTVVPYTVPFQQDGWPDIPHPGNRDAGDWLWYLPSTLGSETPDQTTQQRTPAPAEPSAYRVAASCSWIETGRAA
ncbi:hypothetical protein CCYA_CCYA16G4172 [Cyanidiococcus yangmingshanensis]|nr:hypothetical protein CCYA_CCYA16G4172 [Cyanidiococcus yangmingshanensis]